MKKNISLFILSIITFIGFAFYLGKINSHKIGSPEINLLSYSSLGKNFGNVVAASCGFSTAGHESSDYSTCNDAVYTCPGGYTVLNKGHSLCGGSCQAFSPTAVPIACSSGESCVMKCPTGYYVAATETLYILAQPYTIPSSCVLETPPNCSLCTEGITPTISYTGYQIILNNIYYFTNATGRPTPQYSLGNCPSGVPTGYNRVCEINRISSDGTNTGTWTENYDTNKTTWSNQLAKTYPYSENIQIRCGYQPVSSSTLTIQTNWYQANAATLHPKYGLPCSKTDNCGVVTNGVYDVDGVCDATEASYASCNKTNICGQVYPGSQCPSGCSADATFTNNSCITNFIPSTSQVNPNGSVEFSWSISNTTTTPSCSFVDLTYSTPRPIPGLQNLNPTVDKARITNIQSSTRFCLVCQFYDSITGSLLGEAVKHQWVRVQRIGEN